MCQLFKNISLQKRVQIKLIQLPKTFSTQGEEVIFRDVDTSGLIILNRPKALNAISHQMIKDIHRKLKEWEETKNLVLIKSSQSKAFCAGGDVRAIAVAGLKGNTKLGLEYFKDEYIMNGHIGRYRIPYIALIDGIVMGGGCGLSLHGKYRIASEKTLLAMPETLIGFVTDVGISHIFSRMGPLGRYLALTGHRVKGADVYRLGFATHFIKSSDYSKLEPELLECCYESDIRDVLKKYHKPPEGKSDLEKTQSLLDYCFSAPTMERIFTRLDCSSSSWACKQIKTLNEMSPTSMKLVLKLMQNAKHLDLDQCLQLEYRIVSSILTKGKDFFEGVRALLIDKDKKPLWNPPSVDAVCDEMIEEYFSPMEPRFELKHFISKAK